MQFLADGPDIPATLLQAHEEGRVVFFCGAGVSYGAGLPDFKGLVDSIYNILGTTKEPAEEEAYKRSQFDATLDLLERRVLGHRKTLEGAICQALKPKLRRKDATTTHRALLDLARTRDRALRLVTTNFDQIFARAARRLKLGITAYVAPMLPVPKASRWNGIVYLHGLLSEADSRLVVTSGDFGLAYLTERWASRFVTELFRNYVVVFVGYSINDPVLRYMMDALAADRRHGERTPQAYALGDCTRANRSSKVLEWLAKGVEPILYERSDDRNSHSRLLHTLSAWAETYRDGTNGPARIVSQYAGVHPSMSTAEDDFVGRMRWALSDPSGLPAKQFGRFEPVPTLDWLEALEKETHVHGDLARFGVTANAEGDERLRFSLLSRPSPYTHAPLMALVRAGRAESQWDEVMAQLATWLMRHANEPALVLWVAKHGYPHRSLAWLLESRLKDPSRLEREQAPGEADGGRPPRRDESLSPPMRTLWRLVLARRVKSHAQDVSLYSWHEALKRDGLTASLRFSLREVLAPKVALKQPLRLPLKVREDLPSEALRSLVDWELVLAADHVQVALRNTLNTSEAWRAALPRLLDDFQQLLTDALDLSEDLGDVSDGRDRSHWYMPSVSEHIQNRDFNEWVALIKLVRESWLSIRELDPARATRIALGWFSLPYSTFKRLALFAASRTGSVAPQQWVDWLASDGGRWLWASETRREVLRLLVEQGASLTVPMRAGLEATILVGPPVIVHDESDASRIEEHRRHSIWLRLGKLRSNAPLGQAAEACWTSLSATRPAWQLASNQRDEFLVWMSGSGDPDFESEHRVDRPPCTRRQLAAWLERPTRKQDMLRDGWAESCRERFFRSLLALRDVAERGQWPEVRWNEALRIWSDEKRAICSWRLLSKTIAAMPGEALLPISRSVTGWLQAVEKHLLRADEDEFVELCERVVEVSAVEETEPEDPLTDALNHPVGRATEALTTLWLRSEPKDGDGVPQPFKRYFTYLCDLRSVGLRSGRVVLSANLIALFRVDEAWTKDCLLPAFSWGNDQTEARAAWAGFLWSPRLYGPLLGALREELLETANHYGELGEQAHQFAVLLTYVALEPLNLYTEEELRTAFGTLPQEGLDEAAAALVHALEGAGEQAESYWVNRVAVFWRRLWPKSAAFASSKVAESVARVCVAARGAFRDAVATLFDWLQPIAYPDVVVERLAEASLCSQFPDTALVLLATVIKEPEWSPEHLRKCLDDIATGDPALRQHESYRRLEDYDRRRRLN